MAEYIDKEIAIMVQEPPKNQRCYQTDNLDDAYGQGWDDALNTIGKLPKANVKEIVYAHWICKSDCGVTECSHCHRSLEEYVEYPYCMYCGAEMSEVVE